jgi:pimeloyl-ACP methyl ester carboxylesterase
VYLVAVLAGLLLPLSAVGQPASGVSPKYPVQSEFTKLGPFATTTRTVDQGNQPEYDIFYPRNYHALGFKSPIVTWGNGTFAVPGMYQTLLSHFASYGFTVIATTLTNTGSGREIKAAAQYLVAQNTKSGSVFDGHLDVHHVAAVGHSQGATGAARVAMTDPSLITSLMTFSLPDTKWAGANSDCPVTSDCEVTMSDVRQPTFLISTHGPIDSIIASPATEQAFFQSIKGHAVSGIVEMSEGTTADHNSLQDADHGGHPEAELGYATAWLEYTLRGDTKAAAAFRGSRAEVTLNSNWPGSAVK